MNNKFAAHPGISIQVDTIVSSNLIFQEEKKKKKEVRLAAEQLGSVNSALVYTYTHARTLLAHAYTHTFTHVHAHFPFLSLILNAAN